MQIAFEILSIKYPGTLYHFFTTPSKPKSSTGSLKNNAGDVIHVHFRTLFFEHH
jgi:hypothetical protein